MSALKVVVHSELEGMVYIQVTIQRDNEQLVSATLGQLFSPAAKPVELHWQPPPVMSVALLMPFRSSQPS